MKKIILSGEIGFEVLPFALREEFNEANGEDVEVVFRTPGGFISAGVEMNTIISDYKKEFPKAQMIAHGIEISSMGSHIYSNPSFDLRTVEQASIGMIHNPINGIIGDYNEMRKNADFLDRLAGVMAFSYSNVMGDSTKKTRSIMDEETWYVGGQAIIDSGLADEMTNNNVKETKESAFAKSELRFKSVMKKVREHEITDAEFQQVAAIVKNHENQRETIIIPDDMQGNYHDTTGMNVGSPNGSNDHPIPGLTGLPRTQPANGGNNNNQEVVIMNKDELKEKHPEIYAEVKKEAMTAGINQEKERVKSLVEMKKKKDYEGIEIIQNRIDEAIANGESVGDVNAAIVALSFKNGVAAAMDTNDIGDLNSGGSGSVSGEEAKSHDKGEF